MTFDHFVSIATLAAVCLLWRHLVKRLDAIEVTQGWILERITQAIETCNESGNGAADAAREAMDGIDRLEKHFQIGKHDPYQPKRRYIP